MNNLRVHELEDRRASGYRLYSENELKEFEHGWMTEMIAIFQEQIQRLSIIDKGIFYNSFSTVYNDGASRQLIHQFIKYGIYQAAGSGKEIKKDNGGDLLVKNETYREEHYLNKPRKRGPRWGGGYTSGNPRKPRDWFFKKYYASVMKLQDIEALAYGDDYIGLLADAIRTDIDNLGKYL